MTAAITDTTETLDQAACRIMQARESLGLSQIELAELAGLSDNAISRAESGVYKSKKSTIDRIWAALTAKGATR